MGGGGVQTCGGGDPLAWVPVSTEAAGTEPWATPPVPPLFAHLLDPHGNRIAVWHPKA